MAGGGDNKAAEEASRLDRERQAEIARTQGRVNYVFDSPSRAADIRDYVGAIREFHTDDLNRQKADADRGLRFALARGGLFGGSTQRDQQQRFGEDYSRGVLDVERRAQGAGSALEAADQDARARLIQLATSGLDATTAAQQAGAAMRTNLEAGRSSEMAKGLGDVFGSVKSFADAARTASERRRGLRDSGYSPYQPTAVTGGYYGGR